MKIQALFDLQQDINRLVIAGSKFAKNDPRLLKQIPFFHKLGEKAPVFSKLASEIEELCNVEAIESAEKLMNVSTLLYSILYTQGDIVEADREQTEQVPYFDVDKINTRYSYLQLQPVIKALTESSQGRMEIVEDAYKKGILKDFRTYKYLDRALGDKYSELANYVEKIIPETGEAILPFILKNFSYEGRPEDVRRLRLLHVFKYPEIDEMVKKIMEGNVPNLQAAAVYIMAENPENEEYIVELTADKNKVVREASYMALAQLNTKSSLAKLRDLYLNIKNKINLEGLVNAIKSTDNTDFLPELLQKLKKTFEEIQQYENESDIKKIQAVIERFAMEIKILQHKDYEESYTFIADVLTDEKYKNLLTTKKNSIGYSPTWVTTAITNILASYDQNKVKDFFTPIISQIPELSSFNPLFQYFLNLMLQSNCPKERIYDIFINIVKKDVLNVNTFVKIYLVKDDENENTRDYLGENIDKRWIEYFYSILQVTMPWDSTACGIVYFLDKYELEEDKKFNKFLAANIQDKFLMKEASYSAQDIFSILMKRDIPDKFEIIYKKFKELKNTRYSHYYIGLLAREEYWNSFPKKYAEKFRELSKQNQSEFLNEIADKIEEGN